MHQFVYKQITMFCSHRYTIYNTNAVHEKNLEWSKCLIIRPMLIELLVGEKCKNSEWLAFIIKTNHVSKYFGC